MISLRAARLVKTVLNPSYSWAGSSRQVVRLEGLKARLKKENKSET